MAFFVFCLAERGVPYIYAVCERQIIPQPAFLRCIPKHAPTAQLIRLLLCGYLVAFVRRAKFDKKVGDRFILYTKDFIKDDDITYLPILWDCVCRDKHHIAFGVLSASEKPGEACVSAAGG